MKVVVIQETSLQIDNIAAEITEHWKALEQIPEVTELIIQTPDHYPWGEELHEMIGDADILFGVWISSSCINAEFLSKHPNLKYIATLGHGWEEFDVAMTREKGITITNTIYGSQTIAEYAWSLLMEVCHHTTAHAEYLKSVDWTKPNDGDSAFIKLVTPQIELYNQTIGIVGLGSIGFALAKMAQGFGMKVISYSRNKKVGAEYDFIDQVSFDELLERSDVISLHAPFSASSANMINKDTIAKMKNGVILINTARGGLIVEEDLYDALLSGKIYGAGLDVIREEPPKSNIPLFECKNAIITGHIAWLTRASRLRACDMAIDNFKAYLSGTPVSVIN